MSRHMGVHIVTYAGSHAVFCARQPIQQPCLLGLLSAYGVEKHVFQWRVLRQTGVECCLPQPTDLC